MATLLCLSRRRRIEKRNVRPFLWSVALHLWFAGVAIAMVWRVWPGQDKTAQPQLLAPGDGGEHSTAMALKEKKHKVLPRVKQERLLCSSAPSFVMRAVVHPSPDSDPVTRPYLPGSGWNGGAGSGVIRGSGTEGWAPGSGVAYGANSKGVSSREKIETHRSPAAPGSIVIVLDVSGSMRIREGAGEYPAALWEFIACVRGLHAASSFNVVCFSNTAARFRTLCVPVTAENVSAAVAWAQQRFRTPQCDASLRVPPGTSGTSRLDLGLTEAMKQDPQQVFVISDGQPVVRDSGRSLPQDAILARIHDEASKYGARPEIHVIATAAASADNVSGPFLRRLANEFKGGYRTAATVEERKDRHGSGSCN